MRSFNSLLPMSHAQGVCFLQTVNRLMYRARQRGWLELDLLVGLWAERHLPTLPPQLLPEFEALLEQVCLIPASAMLHMEACAGANKPTLLVVAACRSCS